LIEQAKDAVENTMEIRQAGRCQGRAARLTGRLAPSEHLDLRNQAPSPIQSRVARRETSLYEPKRRLRQFAAQNCFYLGNPSYLMPGVPGRELL
jgi:hypothetical protein